MVKTFGVQSCNQRRNYSSGGSFPWPGTSFLLKAEAAGGLLHIFPIFFKKKRNKTLWPPKNLRKLSENGRFWAQISLSRQEPQSLGRFFSSKSMRTSGPYLALRATDPLWWALTKGPPGWISGVVLSGGAHYQIYQGYPLTMVTLWSHLGGSKYLPAYKRTAGWPFLSITCTGNGHPAVLRMARCSWV